MRKKTQPMIGRWCGLFGSALSFADEIKQAREVPLAVELVGTHANLRVDVSIAGWVVPLWGSDAEWLYLRRPEGVWKARLPLDYADLQASICLRDPNLPQCFGSSGIGSKWVDAGGWFLRDGERCSPGQMDEDSSARDVPGYDMDEVGFPLLDRVSTSDGRAVFLAGDAFSEAPRLWVDRKVVIGEDRSNGRRVGFGINGTEAEAVLANGGAVWLRFCGDFLLPVDALVTVA